MKDELSNIFLKVYIIGYEHISVSWRRGTPISSGYDRFTFMWPVGSQMMDLSCGHLCLCSEKTAMETFVRDQIVDHDGARS
jgi:hypothetical protein